MIDAIIVPDEENPLLRRLPTGQFNFANDPSREIAVARYFAGEINSGRMDILDAYQRFWSCDIKTHYRAHGVVTAAGTARILSEFYRNIVPFISQMLHHGLGESFVVAVLGKKEVREDCIFPPDTLNHEEKILRYNSVLAVYSAVVGSILPRKDVDEKILQELIEELNKINSHFQRLVTERESEMGRSATGKYYGPAGIVTDVPMVCIRMGGEWYTPGAFHETYSLSDHQQKELGEEVDSWEKIAGQTGKMILALEKKVEED